MADITAAAVGFRPWVDEEAELVLEWRLEQLERVGFGGEMAVELADRCDIDLHQARHLVASGCPPALAACILL